jgi:hypothetical protein
VVALAGRHKAVPLPAIPNDPEQTPRRVLINPAGPSLIRNTAKLTLHHCRQDGGDPWRRIAAILAAVMQSEFCGIAYKLKDRAGFPETCPV